jgi:hypothetical protein
MLYRIYDLNSNSLASVRIIITLTAGTPSLDAKQLHNHVEGNIHAWLQANYSKSPIRQNCQMTESNSNEHCVTTSSANIVLSRSTDSDKYV